MQHLWDYKWAWAYSSQATLLENWTNLIWPGIQVWGFKYIVSVIWPIRMAHAFIFSHNLHLTSMITSYCCMAIYMVSLYLNHFQTFSITSITVFPEVHTILSIRVIREEYLAQLYYNLTTDIELDHWAQCITDNGPTTWFIFGPIFPSFIRIFSTTILYVLTWLLISSLITGLNV